MADHPVVSVSARMKVALADHAARRPTRIERDRISYCRYDAVGVAGHCDFLIGWGARRPATPVDYRHPASQCAIELDRDMQQLPGEQVRMCYGQHGARVVQRRTSFSYEGVRVGIDVGL